jgi:hypothetical protein
VFPRIKCRQKHKSYQIVNFSHAEVFYCTSRKKKTLKIRVSRLWISLWVSLWTVLPTLWTAGPRPSKRPVQTPMQTPVQTIARRSVSRVLFLPESRRRPFLCDAHCCAPDATNPSGEAKTLLAARVIADAPSRPLLFGLAPGGVYPAAPLPDARCAFTAPFHPYRLAHDFPCASRRFVFCGTFPRVAPAGR